VIVARIEVAHKDAASWVTEAHRDYFERLVDYGRMLIDDQAGAEDLAQEIFFSAFRTLQDKPDYMIENTWGWLSGSMRNAAANWRRGIGRRKARERRVAVSEAVPAEEGMIDLERALRRLPPRMRACAHLVYVRGLTHQQTAAMLGCGPRTVETHLRRARGRLRRALAIDDSVHMVPAPDAGAAA
jgi:RNA polymerase sigma factor (sigma-70 family)